MKQYYKTKICPFYEKGSCKFGTECQFAHTNNELRHKENLVKTKICPYWKASSCSDVNCKYAHGKNELRFTNEYFKTRLCTYWQKGKCKDNENCRHAHGITELCISPNSLPVLFNSEEWMDDSQNTMQIPDIKTNLIAANMPSMYDYDNLSYNSFEMYHESQNQFIEEKANINKCKAIENSSPLSYASTDTDLSIDSPKEQFMSHIVHNLHKIYSKSNKKPIHNVNQDSYVLNKSATNSPEINKINYTMNNNLTKNKVNPDISYPMEISYSNNEFSYSNNEVSLLDRIRLYQN